DNNDRARHAGFTCRIGHTLPRISGADRPDSPAPLRFRQHRDGICGATQFVSVDRLQVLQFQPDIRKTRAQIETHQWRPDNGVRDSLARLTDFIQLNGAHRFQNRRHSEGLSCSPWSGQGKSRPRKALAREMLQLRLFYERFSFTLPPDPHSPTPGSRPLAGTTTPTSSSPPTPGSQDHDSLRMRRLRAANG